MVNVRSIVTLISASRFGMGRLGLLCFGIAAADLVALWVMWVISRCDSDCVFFDLEVKPEFALAAVVLVVVINLGFSLWVNIEANKLGTVIAFDLSSMVFRRFLDESVPEKIWSSGQWVRTLTDDVRRLASFGLAPFCILVSKSLSIIGLGLALIVFSSTNILLMGFVLFVIYAGIFVFVKGRAASFGDQVSRGMTERYDSVLGWFNGREEFSAYPVENIFLSSYNVGARLAVGGMVGSYTFGIAPKYLLEGVLIIFIILAYGNSAVGVAGSSFLILAFAGLKIAPAIHQCYHSLIAIENCGEVLDRYLAMLSSESHGAFSAKSVEQRDDDFVIEHVIDLPQRQLYFNFSNKPVVISRSQTLLITGESGAGKSTLLRVLSGRLAYNTVDSLPSRLDWGKTKVRFVPQRPTVFDGSLRSNITLGRNHTDEHILNVFRVTGLLDWLNRLPLGLDSVLGPGLLEPSGGQILRFGLARALLDEPDFLFIDEPTASLDQLSTQLIMSLLVSLEQQNYGLVVASHDEYVKKLLGNGRVLHIGSRDGC